MCLHTCSVAFTLDFVSIRPAIRPDEVWQWPASAFEAPSDVEQTVKHIIQDYVQVPTLLGLGLHGRIAQSASLVFPRTLVMALGHI
jgi:hypothetical protein